MSTDFPAGMSQPSLRALALAGYTRLEQLTATTERELLKLHGMGPKGARLLREALQGRGLDFAGKSMKGDPRTAESGSGGSRS